MHTHLYTHTYTYTIYIHTNTHLNARQYLNIPILKQHIRHKIWTKNYVHLCLYDQLQFSLLEANASSDSSSLFFNLLRNKSKDKIVFQIPVGNCSKSLTWERKLLYFKFQSQFCKYKWYTEKVQIFLRFKEQLLSGFRRVLRKTSTKACHSSGGGRYCSNFTWYFLKSAESSFM